MNVQTIGGLQTYLDSGTAASVVSVHETSERRPLHRQRYFRPLVGDNREVLAENDL